MTMSGTLMPRACTNLAFSVAARSLAPRWVRSIKNQVAPHTVTDARMTQARYIGSTMKPRLNPPCNSSGTG